MNVVCVLKSGGDYDVGDVENLSRQIRKNLDVGAIFCLTDVPFDISRFEKTGIVVVRLKSTWPGWWAKMELFSIPGPVLYFDLDTVIVSDLAPLVTAIDAIGRDRILMLRNFYDPSPGSGIMGWNGDFSSMFRQFQAAVETGDFLKRGDRWTFTHDGKTYPGDQNWIAARLSESKRVPVFAQDVVDGIVSYKVGSVEKNGLPPGARIVVFHGKPPGRGN